MAKRHYSIVEDVNRRVLEFIRQQGLGEGAQSLVAGVSGGPDSVCLIHVLNDLRGILDIKIITAYLNHGLREGEARAEERYVARLAGRLGLPFKAGRADVQGLRNAGGMTLEEAAREARYKFLTDLAASRGAGAVAVGHTSDDNVETILMHIIRGSGARGTATAASPRCAGRRARR